MADCYLMIKVARVELVDSENNEHLDDSICKADYHSPQSCKAS